MIYLNHALRAWNTPAFTETLKREIGQLGVRGLPLQQCLSQSSYAKDGDLTVMIISTGETAQQIQAKAGIFFRGVIPGCSCTDDPTPESDYSEYCLLQLMIDKTTGAASITTLQD